ncbi:GntR family transcriptional regulator [Rhizobium sp. CCGE531]|nr:GntR family transcriptional regulator [Rhizobium sp. CCGE531]
MVLLRNQTRVRFTQLLGACRMPRSVHRPLHEKIREEIMQRVFANHYKTGQQLPSTAELARDFKVSAITIKRALQDLQRAGILRTSPGLGTFVRESCRMLCNLDFFLSELTEPQRVRLKPRIQLISVTRERIRIPALSVFKPPCGAMLCLRTIISADGTPIMLDTSFMPLSLTDKAVDEFGHRLVSEILREQGTEFHRPRLLIDAAPASIEAREAFGISVGYPTLRRLYHLPSSNPRFSVFGVSVSPFDRLALHQRASDTQWSR